MAQKPKNFLEVLAQAGSAGLDFMANNYLKEKQQDKQNALSGFMTTLQAQQAEMAQERHRQNTLINQQQMVLADLKISEAMKAMSAKPEAPKTPTQVAQDFAEWFSALNVSGLPSGATVKSPFGTYTAPSAPTPEKQTIPEQKKDFFLKNYPQDIAEKLYARELNGDNPYKEAFTRYNSLMGRYGSGLFGEVSPDVQARASVESGYSPVHRGTYEQVEDKIKTMFWKGEITEEQMNEKINKAKEQFANLYDLVFQFASGE